MLLCVRGTLRKGGALQLSRFQYVYLTLENDWNYALNVDGWWLLKANKNSKGFIVSIQPLSFLPHKAVRDKK